MKRICVFCGSASGENPTLMQLATNTGKLLVNNGIGLVYGGAKIGLMGAIADAVLAAGGEAIGVLPRFLAKEEVAHTGLTELFMVASMHERKLKMSELADGFITLPGGFGTLEELFEVLTWSQLGLHHKPIGVVNYNGYYTFLINQLDIMVKEGLLRQANRDLVLIDEDPENILELLKNFQHPDYKHIIVDKGKA